jgi:hypothetical protein
VLSTPLALQETVSLPEERWYPLAAVNVQLLPTLSGVVVEQVPAAPPEGIVNVLQDVGFRS